MSTITIGDFEWDEDKEKINIKKHGIKFIDVIPIINARITTKKEEKLYYDWCSRNFYS